jgi:hypothetical protein
MQTRVHTYVFSLGVLVLAAVCLVAVGLVSADTSAVGAAGKQRLIRRWAFASEPVSVTGLEAKGRSVQSDRLFAADDEWIKGLRFDVENTSMQAIAYLKVHVLLYGVKGYGNALSIPLQWGEPPSLRGGEVVSKVGNPLAAGGHVSLSVNEEMYARIKAMVEKNDSMANVCEVRLLTSSVMFTDGTVWKGGSLLYPDETRAGVWKERKDDLTTANPYLSSAAAYGHASIIKASAAPAACRRVSGSIFISCCSGECLVTPERATFAGNPGAAQPEPVTISCQPCSLQNCLSQEAVPCG